MTHRHTVSQHRLLGLLLSMIFAPWVCVFASTEKPNIILIVAEDMSSRIGAFGDSVARTPSIDALAEAGIRYTNTFTAAGVCAPNRSALITGVYPQSMGTHQMRTSQMGYEAVPPADVKAFPEL
ncbi:MAG: sulfatase-like hydrolase/transferase, partial [Pseudomonadales bacterium]